MTHKPTPPTQSWWRTPSGLVLLGFLAIAAFFLVMEHRAHVLGALPWILLLLCPLLHLLMHRGHGNGHAGHGTHADRSRGETP